MLNFLHHCIVTNFASESTPKFTNEMKFDLLISNPTFFVSVVRKVTKQKNGKCGSSADGKGCRVAGNKEIRT